MLFLLIDSVVWDAAQKVVERQERESVTRTGKNK